MPRFRECALVALCLTVTISGEPRMRSAGGGELRVKNGSTFEGRPGRVETLDRNAPPKGKEDIQIYQILAVYNPLKRVFVPVKQAVHVDQSQKLQNYETFTLQARKEKGANRHIDQIHQFLEKPGDFDKFGRRLVKLPEGPASQQIVEITPQFLKITALNFDWETAMPVSSMPLDVLDPILRQAVGGNGPKERLKIAAFYIEAQRYEAAKKELQAIAQANPQMAEAVRSSERALTEAKSHDLLSELKLRQRAGQHHLVYAACKDFPVDDVPGTVLQEVRAIKAQYDAALEKIESTAAQLAQLQAGLEEDPRVTEVSPIRAEITEKLNYLNLDRLEAFLNLAADPKLPPADKLALAISGWVLGSGHAVTELDLAINLWRARFLALDYLRSGADGAAQRQTVFDRLTALEGVAPQHVAWMLPLLPPELDPGSTQPGQTFRVDVPVAKDEAPISYRVILPPEYHPDHHYPLIVALHAGDRTPEHELTFWGGTPNEIGQSQRHGYIVIAPEYVTAAGQRIYDYAASSHRAVLASLRDARRRFSVDSDRIFLSGHGTGGSATFDIAMSHPDLFAGVIPIGGIMDRYCMFYWENVRDVPLYVINGQLDRDTATRNVKELMRMMKANFDLIYAEYVGYGPDSFYAEIHSLFDWMSRLRRPAPPKEIAVKTLREGDSQFYWYEFEGVPEGTTNIDWAAANRRPIRPMNAACRVNDLGTSISITSGADKNRIWLAPKDEGGLIDFSERITVRVGARERLTKRFIQPDMRAMLERVRLEGDRQRIYWAMLEF